MITVTRIWLFVFGVCTSSLAAAQEKTYYKDKEMTKEVPEKKGKYLRSKFNSGDTVILQLSRISDGLVFSEAKWVSDKAVVSWHLLDFDGNSRYKKKFDSIFYHRQPNDLYNNTLDSIRWKGYTPATFKSGMSGLYNYIGTNLR